VLAAALLASGCGRIGFGATGGVFEDAHMSDGDSGVDTMGPDAGPGCIASYRLCDGFETASFAPVWTSGPGLTLDATMAHRGSASLHAHTAALPIGTDGFAELAERTSLPFDDPTFYVRAWVRLSRLPINNMGLVEAQPISGVPNEDGLFVEPGALAVYTQYTGQSTTTTMPPPVGAWFCVLWTVTRSLGNTGSLTLAGELPTISLANVQTDGTARLTEMDFGIGFSGSTVTVTEPPMDVWIDDVIVASAPVSCAD
jgi:hypothetical protein